MLNFIAWSVLAIYAPGDEKSALHPLVALLFFALLLTIGAGNRYSPSARTQDYQSGWRDGYGFGYGICQQVEGFYR
jgi:hypothetical protein